MADNLLHALALASEYSELCHPLKHRPYLHEDMHDVMTVFSFMCQLITRSTISNLLPASACQRPVRVCVCVYEWRRELSRQRLSHEVTILQLFSSGLAHKRGSYCITKTEIHICFYYVADEQQNNAQNKTNDAFFTNECLFNIHTSIFVIRHQFFSWILLTMCTTNVFGCALYTYTCRNKCKYAKVTQCVQE